MLKKVVCSAVFVFISINVVHANYWDDIGYTDLENELGTNIPTGAGLAGSQIEAPDGNGDYAPDTTLSEFDGKTFSYESGDSGVSSHATTVGKYYYGNSSSPAPDMNTVHLYEANNYIGSGFLNNGASSAPNTEENDFQNHSWVGDDGTESDNEEILQRFDLSINNDNYLGATGLNNGGTTSGNPLLGSNYNGISVGRSDGGHASGDTSDGRQKPEIVAPLGATSYATPLVAASGAMLKETAIDNGWSRGKNSETLKSILMSGATKDEFDWNATSANNMDETFGAGELNIQRSYHIMDGGEYEPGSSLPLKGWDFSNMVAGGTETYNFNISEGLDELAVALTWNRDVTFTDETGLNYTIESALEDFTLQLINDDTGTAEFTSDSLVDNTEYMYVESLSAGDYSFKVSSKGETGNDVDYSLSWYGVVPEPTTFIYMLSGLIFFVLTRRR